MSQHGTAHPYYLDSGGADTGRPLVQDDINFLRDALIFREKQNPVIQQKLILFHMVG